MGFLKLLATVVFFCFPLFVVHAIDLIEKVQQTYQKNTQFRADFVQKTKIELLDKNVEEQGEMVFAAPQSEKPGKFLIHYRGSQERKYISDGKTLWIYHPQTREVESYPVGDILSHEALSFLGGLGAMTQEFRVKVEKDSWLLLIPRNKKSPFRQIRLKVDPQTFWATEVVLFPTQGNESHYQFSHIQTKIQISPADFEFHTPHD